MSEPTGVSHVCQWAPAFGDTYSFRPNPLLWQGERAPVRCTICRAHTWLSREELRLEAPPPPTTDPAFAQAYGISREALDQRAAAARAGQVLPHAEAMAALREEPTVPLEDGWDRTTWARWMADWSQAKTTPAGKLWLAFCAAEAQLSAERAARARAESQLTALRTAVARVTALGGCRDHSCLIQRPAGQATNGGCRCGASRPLMVTALAALYRIARSALGTATPDPPHPPHQPPAPPETPDGRLGGT